MKTCSKCGEEKPLEEFGKNKRRSDGLSGWCKACVRAYDSARYQSTREARLAQVKRYYTENAEQVRARKREGYDPERKAEANRRYWEGNRDAILDRKRHYYAENRDAILESRRAQYPEVRDQVAERNRKYYAANRARLQQQQRSYYAERREDIRARRVKSGRRAVDPLSRNGFVYRFFDARDRLLYVGLTYNVENRIFRDPSSHANTKPWFPEIAFVWVEEFETYADAQEEERHAYATEGPLYNKAPLYPTTERPSPVAASEFDLETRQMVDL